jgi:hypothetical protein
MIDKIELKLIDDKGNYSIAHIDYKGFVDMFMEHQIDMVHDSLQAMVDDYSVNGKMEIDIKKHSGASHYVSNEEADEDATGKHIQSRSNKK